VRPPFAELHAFFLELAENEKQYESNFAQWTVFKDALSTRAMKLHKSSLDLKTLELYKLHKDWGVQNALRQICNFACSVESNPISLLKLYKLQALSPESPLCDMSHLVAVPVKLRVPWTFNWEQREWYCHMYELPPTTLIIDPGAWRGQATITSLKLASVVLIEDYGFVDSTLQKIDLGTACSFFRVIESTPWFPIQNLNHVENIFKSHVEPCRSTRSLPSRTLEW
jgi:hypothetical protein